MIDFSQNTNVFGPPKNTFRKLAQAVELFISYGKSSMEPESISALAGYFNVPTQNIVIGLGATHIIQNIPHFVEYRRAIIAAPTFWEYEHFNKKAKKKIHKIYFTQCNFEFDYEALRKEIKPGDAVFLCTINNPTSTKIEKKQIISLVEEFPETQFIIDETYLLFRKNFEKESVKNLVKEHNNIHVLLSLSKFFNLQGLRLGVLISNANTISFYKEAIHIPYSISPVTDLIIKHLCSDVLFTKNTRIFYEKQKNKFYNELKRALHRKIHFYSPDGIFILGQIIVKNIDSTFLINRLRDYNLTIRSGEDLEDLDASWLRIAVKDDSKNKKLIKALVKIFKEREEL